MTINRIWQCGFEAISSAEFSGGYFNLSTTAYTGARSNLLNPGYFSSSRWSFYQYVSATKQIRTGFEWRFEYLHSIDGEVLVVHAGATRLLEIRTDISTANLRLIIGGVQQDITTTPFTANTWHHLAIDCKIDAVAGWAKVYHNGAEILSFSGNTGASDITYIRYGTLTNIGASANWFYDDCYIDDTTGEISATILPMLRFYWIYPDGTGNYDQWVGSDGNNIDNYLLIDERPPVTTDYVEEDTVDQFDSYDMTTFALGTGQQIEAVIPIIYAQRYGTNEEIAIGIRYSNTDVIGSDQDPGFGAWKHLWERQTTKPGGGAWDQTALDGVEMVIKSRGTF